VRWKKSEYCIIAQVQTGSKSIGRQKRKPQSGFIGVVAHNGPGYPQAATGRLIRPSIGSCEAA